MTPHTNVTPDAHQHAVTTANASAEALITGWGGRHELPPLP